MGFHHFNNLDMIDGQQVLECIKRNKIPMNQIPDLIDELVESDEQERECEQINPSYEMVLYAIAQMRECLDEVDIYSKLRELEMEACRLMPII